MTVEGLRLLIRRKIIKYTHNRRKKQLVNDKFTIISNNCWGGMVYESFGIVKQSPTVGLFFMADEYIKFLKKFPDVLYKEIEFIEPETSQYVEYLKSDSRFGHYPIGKIDDVEICFLHYHSKDEVLQKWKRRCERIDFDHIIFKMNDQNQCTKDHLIQFSQLPFLNKIVFSINKYDIPNLYVIKGRKTQTSILASQEPIVFRKYYDVIQAINQLYTNDYKNIK